jgi:hypothetical protein
MQSPSLSFGFLSLCLTSQALRHEDVWGVDVYTHVFLISAPAGDEWSASHLGRFTPGERSPCTHWIGGWFDPRTSVDNVERKTSKYSEYTRIYFVPHRKYVTSPLQRPTVQCCLGKKSLFAVRTTWNTQIHCVGRMQSISMLKRVVYRVTTGI